MKVCYSVNMGGYDEIYDPIIMTPGWDYIYLTNTNAVSTKWEVRKFDDNMNNYLLSRLPKIKTYDFFPEYDISIYLDANVEIKTNLDEFIKDKLTNNADAAMIQHPERHCIYNEIMACVIYNKITKIGRAHV